MINWMNEKNGTNLASYSRRINSIYLADAIRRGNFLIMLNKVESIHFATRGA